MQGKSQLPEELFLLSIFLSQACNYGGISESWVLLYHVSSSARKLQLTLFLQIRQLVHSSPCGRFEIRRAFLIDFPADAHLSSPWPPRRGSPHHRLLLHAFLPLPNPHLRPQLPDSHLRKHPLNPATTSRLLSSLSRRSLSS